MTRSLLSATLMGICSALLPAVASAQSLIGDSFTWQYDNGSGVPAINPATVGDGTEGTVTFTNREFTLDVDANSVTVRVSFNGASGQPTTDTWGGDGSQIRGQLRINGLEFVDVEGIAITSVTGTVANLDMGDVSFVGGVLTIGTTTPANMMNWSDGQFVRVGLGPRVTNVTSGSFFGTIADALSTATDGDVIELAPSTFPERGLVINGNRSLTLRGQGSDKTVIDGEGVPGILMTVDTGSTLTLESLAMIRAADPNPNGFDGDALVVRGNATVRDCRFSGNGVPNDRANTVSLRGGNARFERCSFSVEQLFGNANATAVAVFFAGQLDMIGCSFAGGELGNAAIYGFAIGQAVTIDLVNCTFADTKSRHAVVMEGASSSASVTNCVIDIASAFQNLSGSSTVVTRSLYPGATGNNIDATPVFADVANGDYSLAAGSPGIDAADAAAYFAAGGGAIDLSGGARSNNDAGIPDTGSGPFAFLDAGAFEFQGNTPNAQDADFNSDGSIDFFDVLDLTALIEAVVP